MHHSRRWFIQSAGLFSAGLAGLKRASANPSPRLRRRDALGALVPNPEGEIDLPPGFEYRAFSREGEVMDDGLLVPRLHDGMCAFPGEEGKTVLVRNHEMLIGEDGAYGPGNAKLQELDPAKVFDTGYGQTPGLGGTTTLVYDTRSQTLERHFLSLAGTTRNCAGGPTPWGSWLTCEEYPMAANEQHERAHGWVFEVPASATELVDPIALTGMGRFNHEACAVDEASGVVYMTEDQQDGLFYRYVPDVPGELAQGGQLQALAIDKAPSLDTRNWHEYTHVREGVPMEVKWIDLDDVEAPNEDLRLRGFAAGAARFARGEGLWAGDGEIFFTATSGGPALAGQIWRYEPSRNEGTRDERRKPGELTLFLESPHRRLMEMCDNIVQAPWGDLVVCEDGYADNFLLGVTKKGDIYPIARRPVREGESSASEFAGATFSPDGSTLFCNLQNEGITLAITGPWPT